MGSDSCQRQQAIEAGDEAGVELYGFDVIGQAKHQVVEKSCFDGEDFFFGAQDFFFVGFKLGGDVALRIYKCLSPFPGVGHFVFVHIGHLEVVAKNIVETNFQAADAGYFDFAQTYFFKIIFA